MKLAALILAAIISLGAISGADGGSFSLDKTVHDFGTVSVKDGPQSCVFTVTNTGTEPLRILTVISSCGCTAAGWTKEPIAPGSTGKVEVSYTNDEGPYPFDKALTVYFDGITKPAVIHIRGTVTNRKK